MGCSRWGWLVGPTELRRARLTTEAVLRLQGNGPPLLVRIYVPWMGGRSTVGALAQVGQLVEANLATVPAAADGAFPNATEAFVRGLIAAAQAKRRSAASAAIGFAVSPEVHPAEGFWPAVAELAGGRLAGTVDYAGSGHVPRCVRSSV